MPLSWNEIRHNTIRFSKEWEQIVADRRSDLQGVDHAAERALAQSFWLDFFGAFGIRKEVVRSFEVPVKMLSGSWGLFAARLQFSEFNRAMRTTLLECCDKDWSLISPPRPGNI